MAKKVNKNGKSIKVFALNHFVHNYHCPSCYFINSKVFF